MNSSKISHLANISKNDHLSFRIQRLWIKKCASANMEDIFLKQKKNFKSTMALCKSICFIQMRDKSLRTDPVPSEAEVTGPISFSDVAAPPSGKERHSPSEWFSSLDN